MEIGIAYGVSSGSPKKLLSFNFLLKRVHVQALVVTSFVAMGKSLNFSVPQCPQISKGSNNVLAS
jgi:hypothetical protein